MDEFLPTPPRFNKGDSGVLLFCCCKTLAEDADLIKNLPGVLVKSREFRFDDDGAGFEGAGEPDKRTLLIDLLNALAIGVDNTDATDVNLESVFFRLGSPLFSVRFKPIVLLRDSSTPFFRLRFLCRFKEDIQN